MSLHTAFTYTIVTHGREARITIREKFKIISDPDKPKNPFSFLITDQLVESPREVKFVVASANTLENLQSFMNSLTDDLIYNQWFKVKEHKKAKK
jgi:hypothetical protein